MHAEGTHGHLDAHARPRLACHTRRAPAPSSLLAALLLLALVTVPACNTRAVRPGAKSVLDVFAGPTPKEAAAMAVDEYDPNARFKGIQMLASASFAGEEPYMRLFRERLQDEDPGVRGLAARAIGAHGTPADAPTIVAMLTDPDVEVRIDAARALQRLHNPQAIPGLITRLDPEKEQEPRVRQEAAVALGQYQDDQVVEKLIASLADEDLGVNTRVQESLRTLTGNDFGTDRAAWQGWYRSVSAGVFARAAGYTYPVFQRDKRWYEYLPFVPSPPNESPALPAGLSPVSAARRAPATPTSDTK
jgi:hypothetical protein